MRKVLLLAALALAVPMAAWADTIDVASNGGTVMVGSGGSLVITSTLTGYGSLVNPTGTVSLNTGAVMGASSCLSSTAASIVNPICTFAGGKGSSSFVVNVSGTGVVFNGYFTQAALFLTQISGSGKNKTYTYELTGVFTNGGSTSGTTSELFFTTKSPLGMKGSGTVGSGNSLLTVTPEPGTLALLGSGLVGLAGLVRRKVRI